MSGSLIQGKFGTRGNFEVVVPSRTGAGLGLVHYVRFNDVPGLPWSGPTKFGGAVSYQGVSLIQSNFGLPGNLEVVAVNSSNQLVHFWRDSGPSFAWSGPFVIANGVRGVPGIVQSRFGIMGNFEVVVPSLTGGLLHFWRNNDVPGLPWSGPTPFAQNLGLFDAVSLIESNFGVPGNLELAATAAAAIGFPARQVFHIFRDSATLTWSNPAPIRGDGNVPAIGLPALIQSQFGARGNFELVVNSASGLLHFWRDNDAAGVPWHGPNVVAVGFQSDIPSMIESNFTPFPGLPGNLEVITETAFVTTDLAHLFRSSATITWSPPIIVATNV